MGGVILIASLVIWALGYFPKNTEITNDYDGKISKTESMYEITLQDFPIGSDDYNKISSQKTAEVSQLIYEKNQKLQQGSFIGIIGYYIEPVMRPLGFDWKMSICLLAGVAAKEVVVSTMGVLYQTDADPESNTETLQKRLQSATYKDGSKAGNAVFTPVTAFAYLMFVLLYFPCVAVVAAVKKESGNWKWAMFMITYTTAVAWLVAFLVNQVGNLIY